MLGFRNLQTGYTGHEGQSTPVSLLKDFEVEPGKLCVLVGRNGSGKSTFLKTIAGINKPHKGRVEINGKNIQELSYATRARMVSMVLSNAPQMSMFSVLDMVLTSVSLQLSPFKKIADELLQQAENCLEICGVLKFKNSNFANLSDGEKQKVMIARSLLQNTPLLLLDEPLAFLDYPSKKDLIQLLKNICKTQKKTILITSHDLEQTVPEADVLVLLKLSGEVLLWENRPLINEIYSADLFEKFDPKTV